MGDPFKIGLLHYSCPPVIGGVEEVLRQQAGFLARAGHEVRVLAGEGGPFGEGLEVLIEPLAGSGHPEVRRAHEALRWRRPGGLRPLFARLCDLLCRWSEGLDLILAHNVLHMPYNLALTLAVRWLAGVSGGPAVISFAHDAAFFYQSPSEDPGRPPWPVLARPHPRITYVTISEARRAMFSKLMPGTAFAVVSNGIDPAGYLGLSPETVRLIQDLDIYGRDLVLLQPVRLAPHKNLELALRITRALADLGRRVLWLAPAVVDRHAPTSAVYLIRLNDLIKMLDLAGRAVVLVQESGEAARRLVRELYHLADVLLMTSRDEGFGLTLLEAGLLKTPIACSDIPAFREVGRDLCWFSRHDPPEKTAVRIIEYLERTGTWSMYRRVLGRYNQAYVFQNELLPVLEQVRRRVNKKF
ncbi:MAG: glycosyltransferase [Thermodesulfobacteriota bacterium]